MRAGRRAASGRSWGPPEQTSAQQVPAQEMQSFRWRWARVAAAPAAYRPGSPAPRRMVWRTAWRRLAQSPAGRRRRGSPASKRPYFAGLLQFSWRAGPATRKAPRAGSSPLGWLRRATRQAEAVPGQMRFPGGAPPPGQRLVPLYPGPPADSAPLPGEGRKPIAWRPIDWFRNAAMAARVRHRPLRAPRQSCHPARNVAILARWAFAVALGPVRWRG